MDDKARPGDRDARTDVPLADSGQPTPTTRFSSGARAAFLPPRPVPVVPILAETGQSVAALPTSERYAPRMISAERVDDDHRDDGRV